MSGAATSDRPTDDVAAATKIAEVPDSHEPLAGDDLARETVRGVGWTAGAQVGRQLTQTVLSIVVARLLVPADFGQVSQVLVITGLATLLADFGFGPALVQRRDVEERHTSSVFWLQAMLGIGAGVVVAASAPLIAAFYDDRDLIGITLAISPYFLLSASAAVHRAILLRAMRFKHNAGIEVAAVVTGGVVCVAAAAAGAGSYAIVLQQLAFAAATLVLLWSATRWRPKRSFDRTAIRELLSFSGNLLGFSLISYTIRHGDNLLVGRLMGATALGLYTRGYSILLYPSRQITAVIGRVMFVSLSKLGDDRARLRRGYLRTVGVISLITFPLMAGTALVVDDLVPVLLGDKWSEAIPIIRIFALLGITESLAASVGWIYQSTGRTDLLLRWGLASGGVPLAGIVVGSIIGDIESVTIGYAVSTSLLVHPCFHVAGRLIGMRVRDVVRTVGGVAICTSLMAIAVTLVDRFALSDSSHLVALAAQALTGALTYAALVHVVGIDAYRDLRARITDLRRSKSRVPSS